MWRWKQAPFVKTKERILCWWHCYYAVSLQILRVFNFHYGIVKGILPHCFKTVCNKKRLDFAVAAAVVAVDSAAAAAFATKNRHKNRWLSVNKSTRTAHIPYTSRSSHYVSHDNRKYHTNGQLFFPTITREICGSLEMCRLASPDFIALACSLSCLKLARLTHRTPFIVTILSTEWAFNHFNLAFIVMQCERSLHILMFPCTISLNHCNRWDNGHYHHHRCIIICVLSPFSARLRSKLLQNVVIFKLKPSVLIAEIQFEWKKCTELFISRMICTFKRSLTKWNSSFMCIINSS